MIGYLEYLNVPMKVGLAIIGAFLIMQIIGELLEFKGKIVPEFLKIRKLFSRRRKEKKDTSQALRDVQALLREVNTHYSADNITKRNEWMNWVNDRAEVYDSSIVEIKDNLSEVTKALRDNTTLTEEIFVQSSRDRIINFATKVVDEKSPVSREEFNRIFKVYDKYEKYLENHQMTNGEVDISYRIIKESYEQHMRNHSFIEDIRGYAPVE